MALNARSKGANGEREFAKWLVANLSLSEEPKRNLEQVRSGGGDLTPVANLLFEVKRREVLDLPSWWLQVVVAARHTELEPVVAFRQNRKPWEFLISAKYIGLERGFLRIREQEFIPWAKAHLLKYDGA